MAERMPFVWHSDIQDIFVTMAKISTLVCKMCQTNISGILFKTVRSFLPY
jgi:hypothetical protein